MSVRIEIDIESFKNLDSRFEYIKKYFHNEVFRIIISILFDIKLIAQRKIKKDQHIVTSRLRNSIFVKSKNQKQATRAGNKKIYSDNKGSSFNADLNVSLLEFEGAVGTNVEYAQKIEDLDSYLEYALKNVDANKRIRESVARVKKKL